VIFVVEPIVPAVELLSSHLSELEEPVQQMVSGTVYWVPPSTHTLVLFLSALMEPKD
jgi:hypothetical protein